LQRAPLRPTAARFWWERSSSGWASYPRSCWGERQEGPAQPGQILASDLVKGLAAGKKFLFADLGETVLRGFEDPVRLYEVRWQDD